ncbi:aldo/keto reductase [Aurantimonas sp. VKM B-3413]|uniref:aldo/keto reductase n=1 Tax=Aurantimonas sp. VKM B-3413 TaxID=2779401 RepID=UPI001E5DF759|nr:aldo/keto reductase [Aurantimonas sp. VKM B-3413]MCB8839743.1 aldo/keto reductase [Aurantimonas sp. VKM B-3413]
MEKRTLGRSDIAIAPIVFGGNVFGWTADKETSFALLDRFVDAGFNAVDTADTYSSFAPGNEGGESETVIGEWIASRKRRDDLVIMSKVAKWKQRPGLSEANIMAAIDDSLKRLKTDHLDVYFAHEDDKTVPLEETLGAFAKLVEAGKVRVLGASNYEAARVEEALTISEANSGPRYEVLQPEYNLYARGDFEGPLKETAQTHGLGVVTYFSLASGFLTGKYRSKADIEGANRERMLGGYFNDGGKGQRILEALDEVAGATGAKPAEIALAWLIAKDGVTAPIASATSVKQLDETLGAAKVKLSADQMRVLDEAGA